MDVEKLLYCIAIKQILFAIQIQKSINKLINVLQRSGKVRANKRSYEELIFAIMINGRLGVDLPKGKESIQLRERKRVGRIRLEVAYYTNGSKVNTESLQYQLISVAVFASSQRPFFFKMGSGEFGF